MDEYKSWLKNQGKSEKTIQSYVSVARTFQQWLLKEGVDPEAITEMTLKRWHENLKTGTYQRNDGIPRKYAVSSIANYLLLTKNYIDFLTGRNYFEPQSYRDEIIDQNQELKYLSIHQRERLIRTLNASSQKGRRQARNRALIFSMLYAGLTRSEASEWRLSQLFFQESRLLAGVGTSHRSIPMHEHLKKALLDWLSIRDEDSIPHVFISKRRVPLSENGIWHTCLVLRKACDIQALSPQLLRNTFIYDLIQANRSAEEIASLTGIKTRSYIDQYITQVKERD